MAPERKQALGWALYDWANSAFATTVMAGFFPVFFKQYWSAGTDPTKSTLHLGVANSVASIAHRRRSRRCSAPSPTRAARKKRFLAVFAALGVVIDRRRCTSSAKGDWLRRRAAVRARAPSASSGGNVFYDCAAGERGARASRRDLVSALGYALGYLGGGLLFAVNVAMALTPARFGLADSAVGRARRRSCRWPCGGRCSRCRSSLVVREPRRELGEPRRVARRSGRLRAARRHLPRDPRSCASRSCSCLRYWLYIDGVDTVIRMAVDYGMSIGLDPNDLIVALLVTQFVGFPAAIAFGKLGEKLGAKTGIPIGLGVYGAVTVWAAFMDHTWEFYALAVVIGLVQGGVQALSRSLYARLIPPSRASEFFGFYNMLGKFAAVLGPLIVGFTAELSGSPRLSILALLVLFLAGAILLARVDVAAGVRAARQFDSGTAWNPATAGALEGRIDKSQLGCPTPLQDPHSSVRLRSDAARHRIRVAFHPCVRGGRPPIRRLLVAQSSNRYKADLRDIHFVLFEQFKLGDLLGKEPYADWGEEEVKLTLAEVYRFATEVLGPLNSSGDQQGCRLEDGQVKAPDGFKEAWQKLYEAGFKSLLVDPEFGGQGGPRALSAIANEITSGANVAFDMYPGLTIGAAELIESFGTPEQRERYCHNMYGGQWAGTMCLTEPEAGSDVGAARTVAKKNADGTYTHPGHEALHQRRRPGHHREHRAHGARAHRGRAERHEGAVAVHRAEIPRGRGRLGRRAERREGRVHRAQDGHQRFVHRRCSSSATTTPASASCAAPRSSAACARCSR